MKNSIQNIKERRDKIISALNESDNLTLSVEFLSEKLNVSKMTIRRDLTTLEEMGVVIRNFGTATLVEKPAVEGDTKNAVIEKIKEVIAIKAATYLKDDMTIFINTSSTALRVTEHTKEKTLIIVTNHLGINQAAIHPSSTVILSGGEVRFPKEAMIGDFAIETISHINADAAIIGCSGISAEKGLTTANFHESKINKLMIEHSNNPVIVVADYRKIGEDSNFFVDNLTSIDILITDYYANPTALKEIENQGVQVIQVDIENVK